MYVDTLTALTERVWTFWEEPSESTRLIIKGQNAPPNGFGCTRSWPEIDFVNDAKLCSLKQHKAVVNFEDGGPAVVIMAHHLAPAWTGLSLSSSHSKTSEMCENGTIRAQATIKLGRASSRFSSETSRAFRRSR